jgi:DNA polymerase III alpha subunit
VCYLLGLSGIDPIKYNLFSGRFLNEARRKEDVPDIDIDFAREAREAMFEHVFSTYGTERAALVANVIQYKSPMAIRDVGKAMCRRRSSTSSRSACAAASTARSKKRCGRCPSCAALSTHRCGASSRDW